MRCRHGLVLLWTRRVACGELETFVQGGAERVPVAPAVDSCNEVECLPVPQGDGFVAECSAESSCLGFEGLSRGSHRCFLQRAKWWSSRVVRHAPFEGSNEEEG